MKTVLVTGGAGYIGSVLVRLLLAGGYRVRVLDSLKFGGEALYEVAQDPSFQFMKGDVREAADVRKALDGVDAVAHLAAIVGDPACSKFPDEAREVNWGAAVQLFDEAEKARVGRFVFASTCSNYGKMADPDAYVDEQSELRPVSLYAELKVKFEKFLLEDRKGSAVCATPLRFSTVYGFSPRIRFDLTVNEFARNVCMTGKQEIWGPQFNRPYCHVNDLARSVIATLEAPQEKVRSEVFNVGDTSENYTKRMLMEVIQKEVPGAEAIYVERTEDPRDYRVNCDKIRSVLGFSITRRVPDGVREITRLMRSGIIADPYSERFRNV
nr:NAD(P)-dependent oxidoreductase [Ramlibacter albus]